jgi:hypothetical protein
MRRPPVAPSTWTGTLRRWEYVTGWSTSSRSWEPEPSRASTGPLHESVIRSPTEAQASGSRRANSTSRAWAGGISSRPVATRSCHERAAGSAPAAGTTTSDPLARTPPLRARRQHCHQPKSAEMLPGCRLRWRQLPGVASRILRTVGTRSANPPPPPRSGRGGGPTGPSQGAMRPRTVSRTEWKERDGPWRTSSMRCLLPPGDGGAAAITAHAGCLGLCGSGCHSPSTSGRRHRSIRLFGAPSASTGTTGLPAAGIYVGSGASARRAAPEPRSDKEEMPV